MEEINHNYNFDPNQEIIRTIAIIIVGAIIGFLVWKGSDSSVIELVIITLISFGTGLVIDTKKNK